MGWCGHDNYSGDGTQTWHYDFLKWAKVEKDDDIIMTYLNHKTVLPPEKVKTLKKNLSLIIKKIPKTFPKYDMATCEDRAIEWQMLLALLVDNNIKPTKQILKMNKEAAEILSSDYHAGSFNNPCLRRKHIKKLLEQGQVLYDKQV